MTVTVTTVRTGPFAPDGIVTVFPFEFEANGTDEAPEVVVYLDAAVVDSALYSVTFNDDKTGEVEFFTAPEGDELFIDSDPLWGQPVTLRNQGPYFQRTVENMIDREARKSVWLRSRIDLLFSTAMAFIENRAGLFLSWDAEGNPVPSEGPGADTALRTDLANGGDALNAFIQSGANPATQSVRSKLRNSSTHLMDFIPVTEWAAIEAGTSVYNATTAFEHALDRGKRVILPVGTVLANLTNLASGSEIEGECRATSILRPYDPDEHLILVDSGDAAQFIEDLRFCNLTFLGHVDTLGFFEQCHQLFLNGVDGVMIEHVNFTGFRGDGLCLGSGLNEPVTTERHNKIVNVRHCEFDGINRNNRNAISILDCDGFTVRDCDIFRTTKATMPGPIDFEPDGNAFHFLRDITLHNVHFHSCGGNIGQINFYIPAAVTQVPRNVTISECRSSDYLGTGNDLFIDTFRALTTDSEDMAFKVENFVGRDGNAPFWIDRCRGVSIEGSWTDYASKSLVGFEVATKVVDIEFDIVYNGVGDDASFWIGNVDGLRLSGQINKSAGDAAGKFPIVASTFRTTSRVVLQDLEIIKRAAQVTGFSATGHTFTPATNRQRNVLMTGLANEFTHTAPGETYNVTFSWNPANLADGAGETKTPIAVTGLAFGDRLTAQAPYDLQDHLVTAYVQAADVAEVRLQNESGGAVDLADGTWTLTVTKAL